MIFDADMGVVAQAARRWQERAAIRESRRGQPVSEIEDARRITARLYRLSEAAKPQAVLQVPVKTETLQSDVLRDMGLERTLGQSDFQNIAFLELALAVSRFVGRVNIRSSPTRGIGFGTGFMVSPRLLMTNNHVLPNAGSAQFSEVEFDYQLDRSGRQLQPAPFALQPDIFFLTDVRLDFSLVAVAERSAIDRDLKHYGWSRLIADQGKIILGEHCNIIQHPRGQFKQFVDRSNEVVDILDDYLHYVTDTEPGSSGSPVYNDQWEVVALHHSGVPRIVEDHYVDKRGNRWDGVDPEDIDWVANEGVRVSKLVAFIKQQPLSGAAGSLRDDLLSLEPPHPIEAAEAAQRAADGNRQVIVPDLRPPEPKLDYEPTGGRVTVDDSGSASVSVTIPLIVTVALGAPSAGAAAGAEPAKDASQDRSSTASSSGKQSPSPELAQALQELDRAIARPYYDKNADEQARQAFYDGLNAASLNPPALFRKLSELVTRTHKNQLPYAPATHVYPWLDLRPGSPPTIKSIYSGKGFDPRELIEADLRIATERQELEHSLAHEASPLGAQEAMALLEASLPYNCEHVVPQSWFGKREPMRGDLHHLFACEAGCNSFRGNFPYYDFPGFEEALRTDCGQREREGFEPANGKGPIARATLYFLLRYPGLVGDSSAELAGDRLPMLLQWHQRYPVDDYERHRNAVAAEKQGNRNPLIDFPEWAEKIDFSLGLAGATAIRGQEQFTPPASLAAAMAGIAALGWQEAPAELEVAQSFGRYEGIPPRVALLADGRKLQLLADLAYLDDAGVRWQALAGAIVDGASIPQPFWSLIGGPLEGKYRNASIIHDVYCDLKSRSWRDTHRMFYAAMRCSGVGETKGKILYYAVYRFGPRWDLEHEATGVRQREATNADAPTILADAEAIFMHGLSLEEIENLAEARETGLSPALSEAAIVDPAALSRARLLVVPGGRGTAADLEAVAREAASLPEYVMARFEKKKIRIIACRDGVTDFEASLRGTIPRGWEGTGRTWDDVPGTYLDEKKRVVIATVGDNAVRSVPTSASGRHGSISLVVHESLHGYDYSGNHAVLAEPAFLQARDSDLNSLDAYQRQPGQAGLEETFAESGARFLADRQNLKQACPHLFSYWEARPVNLEMLTAARELLVTPGDATPDPSDHAIGSIEENADGSVHMDLRAEGPGGAIGHVSFALQPQDAAYTAAVAQLPPTDIRTEGAGRREGLLRPFGLSRPAAAAARRGTAPGAAIPRPQ